MTGDVQHVLSQLENVRPNGSGWNACCPAHASQGRQSLSVSIGEDGKLLMYCHAGCSFEQITSRLSLPPREARSRTESRIVATCDYLDEAGDLLFQVVRYEPKTFKQRRPDPASPNEWLWKMDGCRRVLFRLPEILAAVRDGRSIYVAEGEKDVLSLVAVGLDATCNAGGAGKWRDEYSESLRGANVIIVPDNDESGRKHARQVARSLAGIAASVKILALRGSGKDVSDWIAAGGTREQLEELAAGAPEAEVTEKGEGDNDLPLILDPENPLDSARRFVDRYYRNGGQRTLHLYQGVFRAWSNAAYSTLEDGEINCKLYGLLDAAQRRQKVRDGAEAIVPFKPTKAKVANVFDALKAEAFLPGSVIPPRWLDGAGPVPAHEIAACANCLVHLPTDRTFPHTPNFFSLNALPVPYLPEKGAPEQLHRFLDDLFDDDVERRDTLQEIFGYFLTADTRQQKIPYIVGPKRSGKGTLGRLFTGLLGPANVCNPTLASLQSNFGLSALLGKQLAIITDARLGKADQHVVAERLLSISGEDGIDIDRKYTAPLTGVRLPTRFLIMTNELLRITDVSGALASRFIVIPLTESFYGREDLGLTDRLLGELPQVLNWAIAGWRRLQERGRFVQPSVALEAIQELEDLSSPVSAFLRECCEVGAAFQAECHEVYEAWQKWCKDTGRERVSNRETFGKDLRAALPGIKKPSNVRTDGGRVRVYNGLRLKSAWELVRDGTRSSLLYAREEKG